MTHEHSTLSKEELEWREMQEEFNRSDAAKRLDAEILQALVEVNEEEEEIRKEYNLK